MQTRLSSLLLLVLAACSNGGGSTDIEATLRFADRTDLEISRLVNAASGSEGFQAQAMVGQFEDPIDPDPCPATAISGNTITFTGGCTTADGATLEGTARITNPFDVEAIEYDWGDDTVYELDGFGIVYAASNTRQHYTGTFVIAGGYTELDMDITADTFGATVRSDIYMDCSRTRCTVSGSGVELVGIGGAKVSGTVIVSGQSASASFTLKGEDTVKVTVENNCVAWHLEGTDRRFDPCN